MGAPSSTTTEWGFYITGDTDAKDIWTDGRKYIQAVVWCPGSTDDTVELTTTQNNGISYTTLWYSVSAGTAGVAQAFGPFDGTIPANNLRIKFSNGSSKLFVYLRSR